MTRAAARHSAAASGETSKMQRQKSACGAGLVTPSSCASAVCVDSADAPPAPSRPALVDYFHSGAPLPFMSFTDLLPASPLP